MRGLTTSLLAGLVLLGCSPLSPLEEAEFPPGVEVVPNSRFFDSRFDGEEVRRLLAGSTRVIPSFGGATVYYYSADGRFVRWHGLSDEGVERGTWYVESEGPDLGPISVLLGRIQAKICIRYTPSGSSDSRTGCSEVSEYDSGRTLTGDPFGLADGTPPFPMPGGLQSYITLLRAMAGCADPQRPCEAARQRAATLGG